VEELIDIDFSYIPPLSSPWDALQIAAQAWGKRTIEETTQPNFTKQNVK
jgi:hypothetical protein